MESVLPSGVTDALARERRSAKARTGGLVARADAGRDMLDLPILKLTDAGFVIAARRPPHISGYVDILRGGKRVARQLVLLSWARDGLAGYEFKRGAQAGPAPADYARPVHVGLLPSPDES